MWRARASSVGGVMLQDSGEVHNKLMGAISPGVGSPPWPEAVHTSAADRHET